MTAFATATDSLAGFMDTAKARFQCRSNVWMIGLLAVVIASIVSSLSYTAKADRDIDNQFAARLSLYQEQAERIGELEQMTDRGADLARQSAVDASLIDTVPRSRVLAAVSNAASPGIRLADISLDAESGTPAAGAARWLHIRGVALSGAQVSQFVTRLGASSIFQSVELLSRPANLADGKRPREFEVTAVLGEQVCGAPRFEDK